MRVPRSHEKKNSEKFANFFLKTKAKNALEYWNVHVLNYKQVSGTKSKTKRRCDTSK